jgi:hypothetical protein
MHNASPKVDSTTLLVAVNRCTMRDCIWPNMAVMAVENPLPGEAGLICEHHH